MNDEQDKVDIDLSNPSFEQSPEGKAKQLQGEGYNDPKSWSNSRMNDKEQTPGKSDGIQMEDITLKQVDGGATNPQFRSDQNSFVQESFKDQGFEKSCCLAPTCTTVRRVINVIGCLLAVPNVALDIAYIAKSTFYNKAFYGTLIVILLLRIVIVMGGFQCYLYHQLAYKPGMSVADVVAEDGDENDESVDKVDEAGRSSRRYNEVRQHGLHLYLSLNPLIFFGTFRLLPSKDFPLELSVGYAIELIFNVFPTFLVQMFNNTDMPGLLSGIQSSSLMIKILLILIFIVEVIIVIWEIVLIRKMRKLKLEGFQKLPEDERRRIHSKKFGLLGLATLLLWLIIEIICLAAAKGRSCDLRHAMESGVCVPCQDPLCDSCLDDPQICEQCPESRNGTALFLSQKGQCRQCDIGCDKCEDDGQDSTKCTQCHPDFYLSQGKYCRSCLDQGCISCQDKTPGSEEQVCNACDDDYFLSSLDGKCHRCEPGCNKCSDRGDGKQRCDDCLTGYFLRSTDKTCQACTVTCANCKDDGSGNELCEVCQPGFRVAGDSTCQDCSKKLGAKKGYECALCNLEDDVCVECKAGFAYDKSTQTCVECGAEFVNCVACSFDSADKLKCDKCDTQIADLDSSGQCLACKAGWTRADLGGGKAQCVCNDILNTAEGYKCQTCETLIENCAECKYTLEPDNKLQYYVGPWNKSHSAVSGDYMDPDRNPRGSQHVICTQADAGLVAVPVDGQYVIKKCEDVFKGCTKCADKGLSCDTCQEGWYRYRSGANFRCGLCENIPTRPGMEYCEQCNEFVCTKCQAGYHKLMGGCFKCYFDWQCSYFD